MGGRSPTYRSWESMRQRCNNPRDGHYPTYGARGIRVCDRWATFAAFLADMGIRPPGTTAAALIPKLTAADLSKLLLDCIFVSELAVSTWSDRKPEKLFAAAKRFKVNVEQVRRTQNAATIPKAKKKTTRKAK